MIENWKAFPLNPIYEISDAGGVRRVMAGATRVPGPVKGGTDTNGYRRVKLMMPDGSKKIWKVHRLVAITHLPPGRPDQTEVAHGDGVRTNNHVSNLRWATRAENAKDVRIHGTQRGTRNGRSKLNDETARQVLEARKSGMSGPAVGRKFGIGSTTVYEIEQGKKWSHIHAAS